MKKPIIILTGIILVLILSYITYRFVWGGKPYIDNFEDICDEHETVAETALDYYNEILPSDEKILIYIGHGELTHNDTVLTITKEQADAVNSVSGRFGHLRVYKDAVFFHTDETGYYGLVYSNNPLKAIYNAKLPQSNRSYRRINSKWYEWGVYGI